MKKMRVRKKLRLLEIPEGILEEVILLTEELVREHRNNVDGTDQCKGRRAFKWLTM